MSSVAYSFLRLSKKYENLLANNPQKLFDNIDFYISDLKGAIDHTNNLLDVVADEVKEWCEAIEFVNSVNELKNIFEKIELFFLELHVYAKYNSSLKEMRIVQLSKESLEKTLKQLEIRNAF